MKDQTKVGTLTSEQFERRRNPIGRLIFWIRSRLVQDVPGAMAQCEFGCRRLDCAQGEWENCGNRIEESKR
jgi:hypothetical protein